MRDDIVKQRAIELYSIGIPPKKAADIIEKELGRTNLYNSVRNHITRARKKGLIDKKDISELLDSLHHPGMFGRIGGLVLVDGPKTNKDFMFGYDEAKAPIIQNLEPEHIDMPWNHATILKFAIIGDTHFGSKYTQFTHLNNFYDICEREGITDVYHAGDIVDGLKMRVGHEQELYLVSADDMRNDVVMNYPRKPGITTHFISGNHDASTHKQIGYDICAAIAKDRPDMNYLGRDCAVVNLTPKCTLELRHPWDASAYSLSYKPQKMIEAMESDSKPNILAIGNYHKAEYLFYRNIHALQTGCFQAQTPFMRGKGISAHMGGWIVTIEVDDEGTIKRFAPEFIPYYASIKDDYKNYKH